MAIRTFHIHDMLGLQGAYVSRRYLRGQPLMNGRRENESCQAKPKSDAQDDTRGRGGPAPWEADTAGEAPFFLGLAQTVPTVSWRLEVEGIRFHSCLQRWLLGR